MPYFLVRLSTGTTLVLEIKGIDSDRAKRDALDEWVRADSADCGDVPVSRYA